MRHLVILALFTLALVALPPQQAVADEGPTPTPKTDPFATAAATMTPAPVGTATSSVTVTPVATGTPSPLDGYEVDDTPATAKRIVIEEVQTRSFWRPNANDVDWAVVYLKVGRWQIAARTTTDIYDPRLTVEGQVADDTGNSKDAVLTLTISEERDYLIFIENMGLDGWGQHTLQVRRLSDPFTPTPYPTYTPLATYTPVAAPPTPYPTYTPLPTLTAPAVTPVIYPTYTPYPTLTAAPTYRPQATYTPYPVYPTAALPSGSTGSGHGAYGSGSSGKEGAEAGGDTESGKVAEVAVEPALRGASVSVQLYIDSNRNGVMDFGEEAENVLVFATTRDRSFEAEGYTRTGEVVLPLTGLAEDEELLLLVPYLHRAASFQQKNSTVTSDVALDLPLYPVYLP